MKKINLIFILIAGFVYSCRAQSQVENLNSYTSEIIGTWISEEDSSYKIEFTSSGIYNIYIDDELEDTYSYSLATSCGTNANSYDIFLKTQSNFIDYTCDVINNIYSDSSGLITLSITSERGQLNIYIKQ